MCEIKNHNKIFSQLQNKNEIIEEKDVVLAYGILYYVQINNAFDCYLFCACINLLNTYVKQPNKKIGYGFKGRVYYLLIRLSQIKIEGVKIDLQISPKTNLLLVDILGVQFSYHNITVDEVLMDKLTSYKTQIRWDQIKKQKCAKTVFDMAFKMKEERSNITKFAEDLDLFLERTLLNFQEGKYQLTKKGLVSVDNTEIY